MGTAADSGDHCGRHPRSDYQRRGGLARAPKDPDALAHALIEIIENPDERTRRAQNAHQRVNESFTVQPQVAKIEAILQQAAYAR